MAVVINGLVALSEHVGEHLGYSSWLRVDQRRIDLFAEATGDHQWIHTDPARAATDTKHGTTIAHGFLTLSLIPGLQSEVFRVRGVKMGLNYGSDRVRYVSPVPVDSDVRLGVELRAVEPIVENVVQVGWRFTVEIRDSRKPALVADALFRYFG